jgi:hypothetical protein
MRVCITSQQTWREAYTATNRSTVSPGNEGETTMNGDCSVRYAAQGLVWRRFRMACVVAIREVTSANRTRLIQARRAVFLIAFLSALVPGSAYAQSPTIVNIPVVAMVIDNPCIAGEVVILNGRMVMATYQRTSGSTFRVIFKLEGTNQDLVNPKKYVLNDENVNEFNSSGATEGTLEINHVLIRQGNADGDIELGGFGDDFKLKTKFHLTFNAGGTMTASVDSLTLSCM